jgi:RNA polymerase sigma-70 factor (ECF subfamily)
VLKMSFFEGKAHGDIAQKLNLPLGTVKSRIRLATERIRNSIRSLK